jgi:hypothetical protein
MANDKAPSAPVKAAQAPTATGTTSRATDQATDQESVMRKAVRDNERAALTEERDTLRSALDGAGPDDLAMLRAEVGALREAAARAGVTAQPRHLSEGVREELERQGYASDPATGDVLVQQGGSVKATSRTGETRTFQVPEAK